MAAILAQENKERASLHREQDILLFPSKSFSLVHQINLTADNVIKNTHKGLRYLHEGMWLDRNF